MIGSDTTAAIVDRIQPDMNSFIHHSEDVQDLAAQIQYVLDQPEIWLAIEQAARATAEEWPVGRGVQIIKSVLDGVHG